MFRSTADGSHDPSGAGRPFATHSGHEHASVRNKSIACLKNEVPSYERRDAIYGQREIRGAIAIGVAFHVHATAAVGDIVQLAGDAGERSPADEGERGPRNSGISVDRRDVDLVRLGMVEVDDGVQVWSRRKIGDRSE